MLQAPSPTNATFNPASRCLCSRIVSRSARSWQGWKSSVRAFTTGHPWRAAPSPPGGLGIGAPDDDRRLPAEHPGDVVHRLAHADPGQCAVDRHREAAELGDPGGERRLRAQGLLVEDHRHRAGPASGFASYGACLSSGREIEHPRLLGGAQVVVRREVPHACPHRLLPIACSPSLSPGCGQEARNALTSSSVSTSGGARRIRCGVGC